MIREYEGLCEYATGLVIVIRERGRERIPA